MSKQDFLHADKDPGPSRPLRTGTLPWSMSWQAWKEIAARSWREASEDTIGLLAAGVAFYAFLSMVPLLGAVVLIYGLMADPTTVVRNMATVSSALPTEAGRLISEQMANVVQTAAGKKGLGLAIALAIAVFGARNAAGGVISALNVAYEEEEKRGFLEVSLLALVITGAAVLLLVLAASAVGALTYLERLLSQTSPLYLIAVNLLGYVVLGGAGAAAAATLYRYGPSRDGRWTWLTPGSLLFGVSWVLLTLGFSFYASRFGNYGATYGSLSAVVVLLTWIYLSSYALLLGAEINSEFDRQISQPIRDSEQPS